MNTYHAQSEYLVEDDPYYAIEHGNLSWQPYIADNVPCEILYALTRVLVARQYEI